MIKPLPDTNSIKINKSLLFIYIRCIGSSRNTWKSVHEATAERLY